jgi:hypothetical protein
MWSMPNNLQSTETIFLYSVLNKCGINSVCCIKNVELTCKVDSKVLNN